MILYYHIFPKNKAKGEHMQKDFLAELKKSLPPVTFRDIHFKDITPSTMSDAKEYALEEEYDKNIFIALSQTDGIGTNDRKFLSEEGGLYLSILLKESDFDERTLTMRLACAVKEAVNEISGLDAKIKWVNDIYYGDRKIAGILVKSAYMGSSRIYTIAGVGININQDSLGEFSHIAASLKNITGQTYSLPSSAAKIISFIDRYIYHTSDEIIHKIYSSSCTDVGKNISFLRNGEVFSGKVTSVTPSGALEILTENGLFTVFSRNEIVRQTE